MSFSNPSLDVIMYTFNFMSFEQISTLLDDCYQSKNIKAKNVYWIDKIKRYFAVVYDKSCGMTPYEYYTHLYHIEQQDKLFPLLKYTVRSWEENTAEFLIFDFSQKLKFWPERLKGKEHLIINIDCSDNLLKDIPNLPNCRYLNCSNNLLTKLPTTPECRNLKCFGNKLTQLPQLHKCIFINCSWNILTSLPKLASC